MEKISATEVLGEAYSVLEVQAKIIEVSTATSVSDSRIFSYADPKSF